MYLFFKTGDFNLKFVILSSEVLTLHKMEFSIWDFFSKCDQIRIFLRIWSHLLKKILNGTLHFLCSVSFAKSGAGIFFS